MLKKMGMVAVLLGVFTSSAIAGELLKEPTVDEIVRKATHMTLYQGLDIKGKITMLITDRQGRIRFFV